MSRESISAAVVDDDFELRVSYVGEDTQETVVIASVRAISDLEDANARL